MLEPNPLNLLLVSLACYRVAQLITIDEIMVFLRDWMGCSDLGENGRPKSFTGKLFSCPYCMGIWIAALLTLLFPLTGESVILWLGIAGAQTFLQSIGNRDA